jgi:hypothetical protein
MKRMLYKLGLRLARRAYVRRAIDERADLSAFRQPPSFRIVLGMGLLVLSYLICWPVISVLGALSVYFKQMWIALLGPVVYVLSHLCFLAGISLTGWEHVAIVLRWSTRKGVEKLLSFGPASCEDEESADVSNIAAGEMPVTADEPLPLARTVTGEAEM